MFVRLLLSAYLLKFIKAFMKYVQTSYLTIKNVYKCFFYPVKF
jgi:hypothetical protein